jgi:hypothetical protein
VPKIPQDAPVDVVFVFVFVFVLDGSHAANRSEDEHQYQDEYPYVRRQCPVA